MKLVVFGFGRGLRLPARIEEAGVWRGLARALSRRGHRLVFFERDPTYQGAHYAVADVAGIDVHLYSDWEIARSVAAVELDDADVGMVTSGSPDTFEAGELVLSSRATLRCFYDVDTPATLAAREVAVGDRGLRDYDIVLGRMGGHALVALERALGAPLTAALYPCADPELSGAVEPFDSMAHALSYLEPFAADRQASLEALLLAPARRRPALSFLVGGPGYPPSVSAAGGAPNVRLIGRVATADRAAFYAAAPLTLHVARASHAAMGYCPSARLFEAAACGVPLLSDAWEGIERFLAPGSEILVAHDTDEALAAIERPLSELRAIGRRARERALDEHSAACRAEELERILGACARRAWPLAPSLSAGVKVTGAAAGSVTPPALAVEARSRRP